MSNNSSQGQGQHSGKPNAFIYNQSNTSFWFTPPISIKPLHFNALNQPQV